MYISECFLGDCTFYDEIESLLPCGANGFALGHAKYYCNRFDSMIDTFDDEVSSHIQFEDNDKKYITFILGEDMGTQVPKMHAGGYDRDGQEGRHDMRHPEAGRFRLASQLLRQDQVLQEDR